MRNEESMSRRLLLQIVCQYLLQPRWEAQPDELVMRFSLSAGFFSEGRLRSRSAQMSPAFLIRAGMLRRVKVAGATLPFSISSHVHGADTGAPGFARTV